MATKHQISHAANLYFGDAYDPVLAATNERNGVQFTPVIKVNLGSPIATDTNALIAAATSTELPNAATKTYTPATKGSSPTDDAGQPSTDTIKGTLCWVLDVPRNVTSAVTHSSSVVAMTITITGFDQYLQPMVESHSITAGTTSKSVAGKKAFKYVSSIALTAAGDSTANTVNMGFADVIGLPYRLHDKSNLMQTWFNDVLEATVPTVVLYDSNTPTATTGDVRGTIDLNSAMNGSVVEVYMVPDPTDRVSLLGLDQYGG